MKLKRFLAFAISVSMVLSIVPAFSLTASAAIDSNVFAVDENLAFDGSYAAKAAPSSASAVSGTYTGWTSEYSTDNSSWSATSDNAMGGVQSYSKKSVTEGSAANKNYFKFQRTLTNGWNQADQYSRITAPSGGYGAGKDILILEWVLMRDTSRSDVYGNLSFMDADGNQFANIFYDKNGSNPISSFTDGGLYRVTAVNNDNNTYDVYYEVNNGSGYVKEAETIGTAGQVNGFGSFIMSRPRYNSQWGVIALGDFSVYAADLPTETTSATVNYVYNSATLKTETVEGLFPETAWTPETPGSDMIVIGDTAYDVVSKTSIDSLSATASENVATVTLERKFGIVKSFIENSDFETGDLTGWGNLSADWFEVQNGDNGIGEKILYAKANGWQSHEACAIGGERSFQKLVTGIESGKVYYYTADVYTGSNTGLWMNYSFLNSETAMTYGNTSNLYVTDGAQTNCTTDACANGTQLSNNYKQQWHTFSGFVTADEVSKAFEFDVYYLHDSPGSKIDNVAFYETDIIAANTTIKFVDSSNSSVEVSTAATVKGFVGDVIDLTAYGEATYTYNGNLYSRDDSNKTSHTVATANDVVTITYTTDAVTSIKPVSTTVIEGNDPVLPETVTGITGKGAETSFAVTWGNHTNLTAGTHTITGTADGISVNATATVTVLPVKFEVPEFTATGSTNTNAFPAQVTGDFAFEFDYVSAKNGDDWIYISQNEGEEGRWSKGNLAIGVGNNKLKAPNSLGGSPAEQMTASFEVGKTYRILAKGNTLSNSYSLTVTAEDGTVLNDGSETNYFRANDTANGKPLNYINVRGNFTLSNIRVYAPAADIELYVANAVAGGTTLETFTVYTSAAADLGYNNSKIFPNVRIPDYTEDGYVFKSKSVNTSAKTITLTYEAIAESNFFDNVANDTKVPSLNMLGAHDAFTNGMNSSNVMRDAAGLDQGDSGTSTAASAGSAAIAYSKTQEKDALSLLNYGVRYFDVRLSRSDKAASYGIFGTGSAPHTNGVFYTTHGLLADEFRPIAYTIAQWAKTHPGEILVLDFHEVWDNTGDLDGNGSGQAATWNAINALLVEAGIYDYVTVDNSIGSFKNITYGQLTENGSKAGIVLIGRHGATNNRIGSFIYRGGNDSIDFEGKFYSYYNSDNSPSSHSTSYIQSQVNYMANYVNKDANGDHPIKHMLRVMQGQSVNLSGLLSQSTKDNADLYTSLTSASHNTWLTELPIVMVDGVGRNTDNLLALLKSCNEAKTATINYVAGGNTVKSVTETVMIGSLYEKAQFTYVSAGADKYYVTDGVPTAPANSSLLNPVPYSNNITINIGVTKLGNVYTLVNDGRTGSLGTDNSATVQNENVLNRDNNNDNGLKDFLGFNWGGEDTYHRIGVAELDVVAGQNSYLLKSEYARTGANTTSTIWAVSAEQYANLHSIEDVYATMNADNTLASGKNLTKEVMLDSEKLKAISGNSGKIILFVNSTGGLYGLDGETLEIVSGWLVSCDDKETVVANGGTYTLPSEAIVYVENNTDLYAPSAAPQVTRNMTFVGYTDTGLTMVNGAQVRIGEGVDGDGKIKQVTKEEEANGMLGSGLRFITLQNNADTVAGLDGVTVGVVITAEGNNTNEVRIPATKWQTADNSVFTTALTNLAVTNYNRKYTARPYVAYTDVLGNEGGAVVSDSFAERSIYQVAAGLLTSDGGSENTDNNTAWGTEILYKVLNAYVNQTGIRLQITDSGLAAYTYKEDEKLGASYTGEAFFEVKETAVKVTENGNVYTATIAPVGANTTINDYWKEYIRINNNNKIVVNGIDVESKINEDGTLTLTFNASLAK